MALATILTRTVTVTATPTRRTVTRMTLPGGTNLILTEMASLTKRTLSLRTRLSGRTATEMALVTTKIHFPTTLTAGPTRAQRKKVLTRFCVQCPSRDTTNIHQKGQLRRTTTGKVGPGIGERSGRQQKRRSGRASLGYARKTPATFGVNTTKGTTISGAELAQRSDHDGHGR